jgi:hypothetical protein
MKILNRGDTIMEYVTIPVNLDNLLLDPNNYRFYDMDVYSAAAPNRIHEESVQRRAEELVRLDGKEDLRALKESIEANGYIPIEVLVVKPYPFKDGFYVVIEGNRRVAAMRWLKKDREGGSPVPQELIDNFSRLQAILLEGDLKEVDSLQHILMGLRHVSGIKQWGGYQRAKLVVELVDDFGLSISVAAKQIGMSSHEASRRYRAFKALDQMQKDEEFGPLSEPRMYRLFHEAISIVKVKEWLGWDDDEYRFTNEENLEKFYKLLVPQIREDEEELPRSREQKIRTYLDVRNMRDILGNIDAEECLFEHEHSLSEALALAKAATAPNWTPRIKAALQTLQRMPTTTLKSLSIQEVVPLNELYNRLKETLDDWEKLTGNKLSL